MIETFSGFVLGLTDKSKFNYTSMCNDLLIEIRNIYHF